MNTTNVSIRLDSELKKDAEELFGDLGLNMTTALTMFLRQAVRTQSIPFEVSRRPKEETLAAMREADAIARDPKVKGYGDPADLLADLKEVGGR
jgi:DNA-damage-inducible protein J